jgi:hypothetical protein
MQTALVHHVVLVGKVPIECFFGNGQMPGHIIHGDALHAEAVKKIGHRAYNPIFGFGCLLCGYITACLVHGYSGRKTMETMNVYKVSCGFVCRNLQYSKNQSYK